VMKRFTIGLALVVLVLLLIPFTSRMPTLAQNLGATKVTSYCYNLCDDADCTNKSCLMYDSVADEWCVDNACACDGDCTGHNTVSPTQSCEDTKTGVVQIGDGSGGITCSDDLYYSAGSDILYMEDTASNKQAYFWMRPTSGDTSSGEFFIHFGEMGGAHGSTGIVDDLRVKSHGNITFEPCCTAAMGFSECDDVNTNCAASAGMRVAGDLNVQGDISLDGSLFTNSPLKLVSPVWIQDAARTTQTVTSTSSGGDYTVSPAGGDTDITGTLTVNSAVEITTAGVISYGAGNQTIIENNKFATPSAVNFVTATNSYKVYGFGFAVEGPNGAGGVEDWFSVTASGTSAESVSVTGSITAIASIVGGGGKSTLAASGEIVLQEVAAPAASNTNFGQYYVKNDTPNIAMFQDDTGGKVQLGRYGSSTVTVPIVFTHYIDKNQRNLDQNVWGSLVALDTGEAINSITTIIETNGISKLLLVLNTCSDSAGSITATGTSVHRDTKAETGSDTSVMTISGTTTDGSDTDASSNVRHAFTNAYITDKWFKGSVTFSTSDVTCTDVDVYSVAFEQVNDSPGLTFTTYDINALPTNNSAWLYSYCYILDVTGDVANVTRTATLELPAADVSADIPYRLRHGAIGSAFDGSTDGFWCDLFLGPNNQTYWEQLSSRVWIDKELF